RREGQRHRTRCRAVAFHFSSSKLSKNPSSSAPVARVLLGPDTIVKITVWSVTTIRPTHAGVVVSVASYPSQRIVRVWLPGGGLSGLRILSRINAGTSLR